MSNHFTILELGHPHFAIDEQLLVRNYQNKQREFHPDRILHLPASAKQLAIQNSLSINQAYQTLRNPLARALYLLELHAINIDKAAPNVGLLQAVFNLRERVAGGEDGIAHEINALHQQAIADFAHNFAAENIAQATNCLIWWRYLEKAKDEINKAVA